MSKEIWWKRKKISRERKWNTTHFWYFRGDLSRHYPLRIEETLLLHGIGHILCYFNLRLKWDFKWHTVVRIPLVKYFFTLFFIRFSLVIHWSYDKTVNFPWTCLNMKKKCLPNVKLWKKTDYTTTQFTYNKPHLYLINTNRAVFSIMKQLKTEIRQWAFRSQVHFY